MALEPLFSGVAEVLSATRVTPLVRRFTLGGPELAGFPVERPGEIITFFWPAEDGNALVPPTDGWVFPPEMPEPHGRNFTVRRWDGASATVEVDFVLHGDHGQASRWATYAAAGDRIVFAGPRPHWTPDDSSAWTLLVADETGLPALTAIVESLPAWHRAIALVEVADEHEHQPLSGDAKLDVHWVHRAGEPAGECDALPDAVRALALPDGRGRVWGAGESGVMRTVRDHLREERGIPRSSMQILGYWKHPAVREWTR